MATRNNGATMSRTVDTNGRLKIALFGDVEESYGKCGFWSFAVGSCIVLFCC